MIEKAIDLIVARAANPEDFDLSGGGQYVIKYQGNGFIGGEVSQIYTDELGKVHMKIISIISLLGCGHTASIEQISGACSVCGRICCINPGCLSVCEVTGRTVCRQHYTIENGIIISNLAKKGFWRLKTRLLAKKRIKAGKYDIKQISYKT